jgi:hypothetical protein
VQLQSALSPAPCARKLEAGAGKVWRWMPWLHGVQRREVLAKRGARLLLTSRSGVWRMRQMVAVDLKPGPDGDTLLTSTQHYDPVLAITSFVLPLAALLALIVPPLHRLVAYNTVDHMGPWLYVFFVFMLLAIAVGMRKPDPRDDPELDPEVIAFLQRELGASPSA